MSDEELARAVRVVERHGGRVVFDGPPEPRCVGCLRDPTDGYGALDRITLRSARRRLVLDLWLCGYCQGALAEAGAAGLPVLERLGRGVQFRPPGPIPREHVILDNAPLDGPNLARITEQPAARLDFRIPPGAVI